MPAYMHINEHHVTNLSANVAKRQLSQNIGLNLIFSSFYWHLYYIFHVCLCVQ